MKSALTGLCGDENGWPVKQGNCGVGVSDWMAPGCKQVKTSKVPASIPISEMSIASHLLVLDAQILWWVLLPIMSVMVLLGVVRHNLTLYMQTTTPSTRAQLTVMNSLKRSQRLRQNAHFLPPAAWAMRKKFLITKTLVKPQKPEGEAAAEPSPPDPTAMMGPLKQQMLMIVFQMAPMGWISYFFSGFVVGKLPFSLTQRFKVMLQRGIALKTLDSSYVSSLSWYFLTMFGTQGLTALLLGSQSENSDAKMMQQQMQGQMMPGQPQVPDPSPMLDAERTEVEITPHSFCIPDAEPRLLNFYSSLSRHDRRAAHIDKSLKELRGKSTKSA